MTNARRLILHRTRAIDDEAKSGSGLRPAKLLRAFRQLGYEVDVVAGTARVRKQAMQEVKRRLESGVRFVFLYAEPPTTPILIDEPHHFPTHPLLDYGFFAYCRSRGVPVVLFYRDVHWRLPEYRSRVGLAKYLVMLPFFHLDLFVYRKLVDALLVPHRAMLAKISGWTSSRRVWASPPGFDPDETPPQRSSEQAEGPLRLFYVGGVEPPVYDLVPLLRSSHWARSHGLDHRLTICTREAEWKRRPPAYDEYLGPHVTIVHNRTRAELLELYRRHDIAVMTYGTLNSSWAVPLKFSEAIGMGLPILAGLGTAVAAIVAEQGLGWVVGDGVEDLHELLVRIDPAELDRIRAAVVHVRPGYSWLARAREIAAIADQVRAEDGDRVGTPAS